MLLQLFLGVLAGIITGLIPGVHVNLVSMLAVEQNVAFLGVFVVALAVTHSFLDSIPSIFLGAPDAAMVLGVLPGHRLLLEGRGFGAVLLTLVGSLGGLILSIALLPFWRFALKLYPLILPFLGWLLLAVSALLILRESRRFHAFVLFVLAGLLGLVVLRTDIVAEPLFPMLSGLFGISSLLMSLSSPNAIPPQRLHFELALDWQLFKAVLAGSFSGFLTSMLPGLGSAQAAVIALLLAGSLSVQHVLVLLGSVNTVNFVLSLLTWESLDKARNGAIVAISSRIEPSSELTVVLLATAVVAAALACILGILLARHSARLMNRVPYRSLCIVVICVLAILVFWRAGPRGLLLLVVSTLIGLYAPLAGCSRAHAMACLLLPTALFFLRNV